MRRFALISIVLAACTTAPDEAATSQNDAAISVPAQDAAGDSSYFADLAAEPVDAFETAAADVGPSDAAVADSAPSCADGQAGCFNASTTKICQGGAWQVFKPCSVGETCQDGNCMPKSNGDDTTDGGPVDAKGNPTPQPTLAPISGGTLTLSADGNTAIAADSQRDVVYIADLTQKTAVKVVTLIAGDEPGRVELGNAGTAYVVLRRAGMIATLDLATATVSEKRPVCAEPRGIAFDAAAQVLYVACGDGELVKLPAAGLPELKRIFVAPDLRDIVLMDGKLWISRFRSAQMLHVTTDGVVSNTEILPLMGGSQGPPNGVPTVFAPEVAWRMRALPTGKLLMAHQRAQATPIEPNTGGYGSGECKGSGRVESVVTIVTPGELAAKPAATLAFHALPVDAVLSPDGQQIAVINAGADAENPISSSVNLVSAAQLTSEACHFPMQLIAPNMTQAVAIAWSSNNVLVVQTRQPAIFIIDFKLGKYPMGAVPPAVMLALPGANASDVGHTTFHRATMGGLACASCHPEGREDGHIWQFATKGGTNKRRTQPLTGGVGATGPFRWEGDFDNMSTLMDTPFSKSMGGGPLQPTQLGALANWVNALPAPATITGVDAAQAVKGKVLFDSAALGCATCHNGPHMTNNLTMDVSTGAPYQVPSLIGLSARLPLMHDGCAQTVAATLGPCAGATHDKTASLPAGQLAELVAYLGTL